MDVVRAAQALDALFAKLSDAEMREAGLEAIRACIGTTPAGARPLVQLSYWNFQFLRVLAPKLPVESQQVGALTTNDLIEVRPRFGERYVMTRDFALPRFWNWMHRAGFALAVNDEAWALTDLGMRRLDSDHPCRPGALERLRAAVGSTFDDSLARVDDALACLEAGLARPAVVLLGLAYEELISVVLARLEGKDVAQLKGMASERQEQLRKRLEFHPKCEARSKALCALNVADTIRDERNDAVHKAAGEWDPVEVEELVNAGIGAYAKLALYEAKP